ncbi:FecR family protein [Sphingobacterium sp. SGG-5]|uniref:FecR family protein n=1 Tax=Sphingobacterium sp. SGG-5 TaxID=2710881 RepID=UPI0013EA753C|nr:FecR domain-containing protein [Sphingobacterium sp. SGG-5]NGM61493.1 FecR family protein [Sphingobacterium sp. SGG-5]
MSNRFLKNRFRSIIDKYLKGTSSAEQQNLVDYFYDSIPDEDISEVKLSAIERDMKGSIDRSIKKEDRLKRRTMYLKVASAAVVLIVSSFYIYNNLNQKSNVVPLEDMQSSTTEINTAPETPVFVLEDGQSYTLLDSAFERLSSKLIDGERVFILPDDLPITDDSRQKLSQIKNPTDKVFAFRLQDGTTAWLNPNSTLDILPETDGKRLVRIEGTVLFDVQKIKEEQGYKPFVVKTALQTIEVLGTKFIVNSVNTLEDVLLLEGKVRLTHNKYKTAVVLKPNQKASLKEAEANILVTKSTDNYKIEAWHKGLFHFENEKMADVMAEISQWYGQTVTVDPAIKDIPITGMISRYKRIEEVLELIELTNNVKYHREEGKIYVE